jgi:CheY-like chemotaxis protein
MPDMDSFAATRAIRQAEQAARRVTIVAMAANPLTEDPARCLAAGIPRLPTKPMRRKRCDLLAQRSSTPIACDVSGRPRRLVKPQALDCLRSCCLVKRPVAYSSNARRTSGARSGSGIRLLPIARGAFK